MARSQLEKSLGVPAGKYTKSQLVELHGAEDKDRRRLMRYWDQEAKKKEKKKTTDKGKKVTAKARDTAPKTSKRPKARPKADPVDRHMEANKPGRASKGGRVRYTPTPAQERKAENAARRAAKNGMAATDAVQAVLNEVATQESQKSQMRKWVEQLVSEISGDWQTVQTKRSAERMGEPSAPDSPPSRKPSGSSSTRRATRSVTPRNQPTAEPSRRTPVRKAKGGVVKKNSGKSDRRSKGMFHKSGSPRGYK